MASRTLARATRNRRHVLRPDGDAVRRGRASDRHGRRRPRHTRDAVRWLTLLALCCRLLTERQVGQTQHYSGVTHDNLDLGLTELSSYPGNRTRYRLLCVVRLHDRCADADAAGNTLASLTTIAPGFAETGSCSSRRNAHPTFRVAFRTSDCGSYGRRRTVSARASAGSSSAQAYRPMANPSRLLAGFRRCSS